MKIFERTVFLWLFTCLVVFAAPEDERWVEETFNQLSLKEKVSQMFAGFSSSTYQNEDQEDFQRVMDLVENFKIGSIMYSHGTPMYQVYLSNLLQKHSDVPLLISQDLEWGTAMRLEGTTDANSMMALGAIGSEDAAYEIGRLIGQEARSLGVHQVYAPVVDVNNNPRNPIINTRSFGEDPVEVAALGLAYARGLRDAGALATAKHFPGHGDTSVDSHKGLPVLEFGMDRLNSVEFVPFKSMINNGVPSIMVGHLWVKAHDSGNPLPSSLSPNVVEGILRKKLNFQGLVVTDSLGMSGVTDHFGVREAAVLAVLAGNDILLMSPDPYSAREAILEAVSKGRIPKERIDQSVKRILKAKYQIGLSKNRYTDENALGRHLAGKHSQAVTRYVAQKSLTLLANRDNIIPLKNDSKSYALCIISDKNLADRGSLFKHEIKKRLGSQLSRGVLVDTRTSEDEMDALLADSDPETRWIIPCFLSARTKNNSESGSQVRAFLQKLVDSVDHPVVLAFGDPYVLEGLSELGASIACYSQSENSERACAQALFGELAFSGHLPIQLPPGYEKGEGLKTVQTALREGLAEEAGFSSELNQKIDKLIKKAISDKIFPAAAVAVGRGGILVHNKGYGYLTYDSEIPVSSRSLFDLASLTKVVATTSEAMILFDQGKLDLNMKVADVFPDFAQGGKQDVTILHLLTHTSGMVPFLSFDRMGLKGRDAIQPVVFKEKLNSKPGSKSVYSDLNMIVLAWVLEKITGTDPQTFLESNLWKPLGMNQTGYRPIGIAPADDTIVPTEWDHTFRKRLIQGEVHDENSYLLGGIAGHAGVFSSSTDMAQFAFWLLNGGSSHGDQIIKPETLKVFTNRHSFQEGPDRALGWDIKSLDIKSSAGKYAGPRTFGHLGFTGTSIWVDPDEQVFFILLSNRVYPSRSEHRINSIRGELGNIVYECISGPPELHLRKAKP